MRRFLLSVLFFVIPGLRGEGVAIVVDKNCKLDELSLAEVRAILHCEKVVAPSRAKWTVFLRQKSTLEYQAVLKFVFKCNTNELDAYFRLGEFNGSIDPPPKVVASVVMLRHLLVGNIAAISYVRASEVPEDLKVLRVDGMVPGDPNYPIHTLE